MNENQEVSKREKSAAIGLVVCFIGMIAIVGMITFSQYQRKLEEQKQLAEAEMTEENNDMDVPVQISNTDAVQAELEQIEKENTDIVREAAQDEILSFTVNDVLAWPMEGNVILGYSMDKTVYFSTLDQYKYHPAILIAGEVETSILAAADGKIESIQTSAQTGTTITMSLGNGYKAVYGQVKELTVQEGDIVSKGEKLGVLSEPTKYYSVEGPNLYFQVLKDETPVNPMEYMEG